VRDMSGRWRTTTFDDPGDLYGSVGDRLRVIAGSCLYRENPSLKFILLGGKGQHARTPGAPTLAEVIQEELQELGVPPENIFLEKKSGNTYESLFFLKEFLEDKNLKDILLISNKYHLPRIKAMIKGTPELNLTFSLLRIRLMSAEKILITHEPKIWRKKIAAVYNSAVMKKRLSAEKKGIEDFKNGKYKFIHY